MKSDRYQSGLSLMKRLHGEHSGEEILNTVGEICPAVPEMAIEWVFGDIMQRPGLDLITRELALIAVLAAQGNAAPQLKAHIEAALNVGASKEAIIEVMLQTAIYAGFPVAINAMMIAKAVFAESKV